jgi:hypothetical protein
MGFNSAFKGLIWYIRPHLRYIWATYTPDSASILFHGITSFRAVESVNRPERTTNATRFLPQVVSGKFVSGCNLYDGAFLHTHGLNSRVSASALVSPERMVELSFSSIPGNWPFFLFRMIAVLVINYPRIVSHFKNISLTKRIGCGGKYLGLRGTRW